MSDVRGEVLVLLRVLDATKDAESRLSLESRIAELRTAWKNGAFARAVSGAAR